MNVLEVDDIYLSVETVTQRRVFLFRERDMDAFLKLLEIYIVEDVECKVTKTVAA